MRPRHLDGDEVKANELFMYAVENIDADIIVLCHATGPFIESDSIRKGVEAVASGKYDCSFAVQKHLTYSWYDGKPLNYDPLNMSQTQDLTPVFCETSGFYIFRKEDYLKNGSRIGDRPFMVEVNMREAVDIDEPDDFSLATQLIHYNPNRPSYSQDMFFVEQANNHLPHKNIEHIAFDLDGVLIDSLALMSEAWEHAMSELQLIYSFSEYKKRVGMPFYEILKAMGVDSKYFNKIEDVYNKFAINNSDKICEYPAVKSGLIKLKKAGVKLSVVTSKNKQRTEEIINKLFDGVEFDVVVTPDDTPSGRGKPNPDPILYACIQLGVDPNNSLYIGDMDVDREASKRAGTHFVYANWGYGDLTKIKDVWFNAFSDLVDYIIA